MKLSNHEKAMETYYAIQNKRKQVAKLEKIKQNEIYKCNKLLSKELGGYINE